MGSAAIRGPAEPHPAKPVQLTSRPSYQKARQTHNHGPKTAQTKTAQTSLGLRGFAQFAVWSVRRSDRFDRDEPAAKFHYAIRQREQRVIPPAADVGAGFEGCAALAHDDAAELCELATEQLHAAVLGVAVASVAG
jgi:hypothetical protein